MSEEKFSQAPWDIEEPVKDDELRYNDGYNYTIWGGHKKTPAQFSVGVMQRQTGRC